jgi:uncharacterized membrane protein
MVVSILEFPMKIMEHDNNMGWAIFLASIFGLAYYFLFLPIITYAADLMFIQAVRSEKIEVETILVGFKNYLNIVLAHLLTVAIIGLGVVAILLPGIIFACRLVFVSYLVMDKHLDPISAVEESWRMTRGHGWRIFWMAIVSFFIYLAGLIMLVVGIIPARIWVKASFATLYQSVLNETEGVPETEPAQ